MLILGDEVVGGERGFSRVWLLHKPGRETNVSVGPIFSSQPLSVSPFEPLTSTTGCLPVLYQATNIQMTYL